MAIGKKNKSKLSIIFASLRPNTWMRTWGEMIIAAILAGYPNFNFARFLVGFLATSPLLWSAAYLLNDLTDINLDKQHNLRRLRATTSGIISKKETLVLIAILVIPAFIIAAFLSRLFLFFLTALFVNQLLYTVKPIRLKERFFWDIFINSLNSAFRFFLGWATQTVSNPFLIAPMLMLILVKAALFLGHRVQNRELEIANGIQSTVTVLNRQQIFFLIALSITGAGIIYYYCLITGIFPISSIMGIITGILIIAVYFIKNKKEKIVRQESNLGFRNILYLSFFTAMNLIALSVLIAR